ncbi:autotransporter-associated beta strand repeat-containing protein [Phreatobacter sp. AB_2022a]|uniref:autotransporter-associated beta strand repeat-containing protein n=1 Tax=Phreatobacter sp. AB_2022a TaxID=3003134 RepID=UPI0022874386|nr:autotransporter-associated beta strand repeat-containing protein [Phreatobacter sp. AB_2022a]MCZ0736246.1 autotransporter-associated beta strand repeat-containing protein [Phreatobacter sp. AB_2022a]
MTISGTPLGVARLGGIGESVDLTISRSFLSGPDIGASVNTSGIGTVRLSVVGSTIEGQSSAGVSVGGSVYSGAITVNIDSASTLYGSTGLHVNTGVVQPLASATVTVGGSILGSRFGILSGGNVVLELSGSVSGSHAAIAFNGGTNRITLQDGARVLGQIWGWGDTTLVFDGSGFNSYLDQAYASRAIKNGTGTWVLNAASVASAAVQGFWINSGTIELVGSVGSLAPGSTRFFNAGTLSINSADYVYLRGEISGTGKLVQTGPGTTVLTAENTYIGGTFIDGGRLHLGEGGLSGSLSGSIANNGVLAFHRFDLLTVANPISGAGRVEQIGEGTTILSAINSYAGGTVIRAGRLAVSQDDNLGAAAGGILLDGGTLAIFGRSFASTSREIALGAGGGISVDEASHTFTIARPLSGSGWLAKRGAGTLVLTGASTYAGATFVSAGRLHIGDGGRSGSIAGLIVNDAVLAFNRSDTFTVSNPISGTGKVEQTGSGATILSGFNSYAGGTLIQAGRLSVSRDDNLGATTGGIMLDGGVLDILGQRYSGTNREISLGAKGGGISIDEVTNAFIVLRPLTGSGGLTKLGAGSLILTGASTHGGGTDVRSGGLFVAGSLASDVWVRPEAVIGGSGSIGKLRLDGTVSPGFSIGTLTINGTARFGATSQTVIEVAEGRSDKVVVMGEAQIGGRLVLIPRGMSFSFGKGYSILEAYGGISGRFHPETIEGSFGPAVTTRLSYSSTEVVLTLSPNVLVPVLGAIGPPNAAQVASAIDRAVAAGADSSRFFALYMQGPEQMTSSLAALSGEAAIGMQNAAFSASSQFLNMMLDPMAGARGALASGSRSSLIEMADMPGGAGQNETARRGEWAIWTKAFGQSGRTNGDHTIGASSASHSVFGVAAGADRRLGPDALFGFALAGGGSAFGLGSRGGGTGDLFQIGLYGSSRLGPGYVSAAFAYGVNAFDMKRNVNLADLSTYRAQVTAQTVGGRIELGQRFGAAAAGWAPYVALEAIHYAAPSYRETPGRSGDAFALAFAGKTSTSMRVEPGLRFDRQMRITESSDLILYGRFAWAYQATADRSIDAQFQTLSGAAFTTFGGRPSMHTALMTVGTELRLANGLRLSSSLDGEIGTRHQALRANAALRVEW